MTFLLLLDWFLSHSWDRTLSITVTLCDYGRCYSDLCKSMAYLILTPKKIDFGPLTSLASLNPQKKTQKTQKKKKQKNKSPNNRSPTTKFKQSAYVSPNICQKFTKPIRFTYSKSFPEKKQKKQKKKKPTKLGLVWSL